MSERIDERFWEVLSKYNLQQISPQWCTSVAKLVYAKYDKSHGCDHIADVLEHGLRFLKKQYGRQYGGASSDDAIVVIIILHDAWDPKYAGKWFRGAETREVLHRIISKVLKDTTDGIFAVIDNMSFTRERKGGNTALTSYWEGLRLIAQLADWYTSVGEHGLVKSVQYNRAMLPDGSDIAAEVKNQWSERFEHYLPMVRKRLEAVTEAELHVNTAEVISAFQSAHDRMHAIIHGDDWVEYCARIE